MHFKLHTKTFITINNNNLEPFFYSSQFSLFSLTLRTMKRIFASFFILLTFFASVNVYVDMHLCKGEVKSYSLFGEAKKCFGFYEALEIAQENQLFGEAALSKASCCGEQQIIIESQTLKEDHKEIKGAQLFVPSAIKTAQTCTSIQVGKAHHAFLKSKVFPEEDLWLYFENYRL